MMTWKTIRVLSVAVNYFSWLSVRRDGLDCDVWVGVSEYLSVSVVDV